MIEVSIVTTREDVLGSLKTAVGSAGVLCGRRPGTDQDVEKTLPLCPLVFKKPGNVCTLGRMIKVGEIWNECP